jgi:hypothetical protein
LKGNTLIDPVVVGTIAILLVTAPSVAFSVATSGWVCPCGHMVMKPKGPGGTTVTLNTKARAVAGTPQGLAVTFTSIVVLKGGVPGGRRESSTRQAARDPGDGRWCDGSAVGSVRSGGLARSHGAGVRKSGVVTF